MPINRDISKLKEKVEESLNTDSRDKSYYSERYLKDLVKIDCADNLEQEFQITRYHRNIIKDSLISSSIEHFLLNNPNHHVVIAPSGYGKTAFLRKIQLMHVVSSLSKPNTTQTSTQKLCIYVSLSEYILSKSPTIKDFIFTSIATACVDSSFSIDDLITNGRLILLLDGIDQIKHHSNEDFKELFDQIRLYREKSINNNIIFTCRASHYNNMTSMQNIFTSNHYRDLLPDNYNEISLQKYESQELCKSTEKRQENLIASLKPIYSIPYYKSILNDLKSNIKDWNDWLPDSAAVLLANYVKYKLIQSRQNSLVTELSVEKLNSPLTKNEKVLFAELCKFAYEQLIEYSSINNKLKSNSIKDYRYSKSYSHLQNELDKLDYTQSPGNSKYSVDSNNFIISGILRCENDAYAFHHHLLQSFLAAYYMHKEFGIIRQTRIVPSLSGNCDDMILFLAHFTAKSYITDIVDCLFAKRMLLACQCLQLEKFKLTYSNRDAYANRIFQLYSDASLSIHERTELGIVYGKIKNLKISTSNNKTRYILSKFERVIVDDESYNNSNKFSVEKFEIASTPVTNEEYAFFIEDGGYENIDYWKSDLAKKWLKDSGVMYSWIREDFEQKIKSFTNRQYLATCLLLREKITVLQAAAIYKFLSSTLSLHDVASAYRTSDSNLHVPRFYNDSRFNAPNQPVVGISWFEASAYCCWLSKCTGEKFRLPTEWEWQYAAEKLDKNDLKMLNVRENNINKTSPVGVSARIEFGSFCGNVFEWQNNLFMNDNGDVLNQKLCDVLERLNEHSLISCRGGSWGHAHERSGSKYRGRGKPFVRNNDLGFRLLREIGI